MAFPTPPQPEIPTAAVAAATTNTPIRGLFPRPPQNPIYPITTSATPRMTSSSSNPNPNYPQLAPRPDHSNLRYPGRSYNPRPVNNSRNNNNSNNSNNYNSPRRPFVFSYPDPNPFYFRPPQMRSASSSGPVSVGVGGVVPPGVGRGIYIPSPQQQQYPKLGGMSILDTSANGHSKQQLRNKDDVSVTIRDRKVRVTNSGSLYSHCRSWLRNGVPEEAQPQYLDNAKALPKPLPLAAEAVNSVDKKEGDKEEGDEDEVSVEHLSAKELLQRHVKRAKKVRSRLREERLERITRYKTRLGLLLPPMVDQSPLKNETN